MNKIHSLAEWIARAKDVLPAGGFGNFDHSIIIARGGGVMSGMKMEMTTLII